LGLFGAAVIGWKDWQLMSTPGSNPATGYLREWADTSSNTIKCIDHSGAACFFASSGGGGGGSLRAIGMAFGMTTGSALAAGSTQYVTIPFACTIQQWDLTVDAGTATVDVWKIPAAPVDWFNAAGTVNTSGTAVTWVSGNTFVPDSVGLHITINSVLYIIASYTSSTAITLTSSAGTQSAVAFVAPGNSVPTVTNTITGFSVPAISSGTAKGSTVLGGWTTSVVKNDVFGFNISAVSTAKALTIVLECQQ
jgi:hypothetical protein